MIETLLPWFYFLGITAAWTDRISIFYDRLTQSCSYIAAGDSLEQQIFGNFDASIELFKVDQPEIYPGSESNDINLTGLIIKGEVLKSLDLEVSFAYCDSTSRASGYCSERSPFEEIEHEKKLIDLIKANNLSFAIESFTYNTGETYSYPVDKSGVYCLIFENELNSDDELNGLRF